LLRAHVYPKTIFSIVGVTQRTVRNIRKAINDGVGIRRKPGSGGGGKKTDKAFLETLAAKINKDPTTSMRKLAAELQVDPKTVRKAVQQDLGLKSYVRTPKHLLTDSMKARRLKRARKVMGYIRRRGSTVRIFLMNRSLSLMQLSTECIFICQGRTKATSFSLKRTIYTGWVREFWNEL